MSRALSYAVIAVLAALAVVYFTMGPSVLLGGPSKSDIVEVARQAMIASAPDDAAKKLATEATISPRGICNSMPNGTYACIVEVVVAGQPATSMVSEMKKDSSGAWVPAG